MRVYHDVLGIPRRPIAYQFDADGRTTRWIMADAHCEDPACECRQAIVALAESSGTGRRLTFAFALDHEDVEWTGDPTPADRAIVAELVGDHSVRRRLFRHRQLVKISTLLELEMPAAPLADQLYTFQDFPPMKEAFLIPFGRGSEEWAALDQWGLGPRASRHEVLLDFCRVDPVERRAAHVCHTVLDLRTGRPGPGMVDPLHESILSDFLLEMDDGEDHLRLRGELIRKVGAKRFRPEIATRRGEGRIGRNDPCHCRSGKKFKKCCGR